MARGRLTFPDPLSGVVKAQLEYTTNTPPHQTLRNRTWRHFFTSLSILPKHWPRKMQSNAFSYAWFRLESAMKIKQVCKRHVDWWGKPLHIFACPQEDTELVQCGTTVVKTALLLLEVWLTDSTLLISSTRIVCHCQPSCVSESRLSSMQMMWLFWRH